MLLTYKVVMDTNGLRERRRLPRVRNTIRLDLSDVATGRAFRVSVLNYHIAGFAIEAPVPLKAGDVLAVQSPNPAGLELHVKHVKPRGSGDGCIAGCALSRLLTSADVWA